MVASYIAPMKPQDLFKRIFPDNPRILTRIVREYTL